jgi:hypothetical protein
LCNKKIKYALVFGVLFSVFLITGMSQAGGPFRDVLFQTFCSSLPYNEKVGCNGYLQYRIQRGKDRDTSLNNCIWGCGEVMDDPTKIEDCQKGCRETNEKDN